MIINISSGAGRFTLPLLSLYAASKFALEGFSEALSFELSALNITVKIIEPGGTATNFNKVTAKNSLINKCRKATKILYPLQENYLKAW
jgi:short-subunit dehydrogenase